MIPAKVGLFRDRIFARFWKISGLSLKWQSSSLQIRGPAWTTVPFSEDSGARHRNWHRRTLLRAFELACPSGLKRTVSDPSTKFNEAPKRATNSMPRYGLRMQRLPSAVVSTSDLPVQCRGDRSKSGAFCAFAFAPPFSGGPPKSLCSALLCASALGHRSGRSRREPGPGRGNELRLGEPGPGVPGVPGGRGRGRGLSDAELSSLVSLG